MKTDWFQKIISNKIIETVNSVSIISITNKQGIILFANDLFCKYSEYTKNELIGKTHSIINSGFHDKYFFSNLWKTILNGKSWSGEICNKSKKGKLYWVDTIIAPIFEGEKISGFVSIRNIITAKKQAELRVKNSENELQQLFNSLNDVIYKINSEGKIIMLNKAFTNHTGYNIKSWIGKPFEKLIHPNDIQIA